MGGPGGAEPGDHGQQDGDFAVTLQGLKMQHARDQAVEQQIQAKKEDASPQQGACHIDPDLGQRTPLTAQHRDHQHQRHHRDVLHQQDPQSVAAMNALDFSARHQKAQHDGCAAERHNRAEGQGEGHRNSEEHRDCRRK